MTVRDSEKGMILIIVKIEHENVEDAIDDTVKIDQEFTTWDFVLAGDLHDVDRWLALWKGCSLRNAEATHGEEMTSAEDKRWDSYSVFEGFRWKIFDQNQCVNFPSMNWRTKWSTHSAIKYTKENNYSPIYQIISSSTLCRDCASCKY